MTNNSAGQTKNEQLLAETDQLPSVGRTVGAGHTFWFTQTYIHWSEGHIFCDERDCLQLLERLKICGVVTVAMRAETPSFFRTEFWRGLLASSCNFHVGGCVYIAVDRR